MAIVKSTSQFLPSTMTASDKNINVNRSPEFISKNTRSAGTFVDKQMPVFRFPSLMYGAALSTGSSASENKATDQLDQSQEVSADPRQLLQVWS